MSATGAALSDSTMITVVGHQTPYPYGKVKDAVLYLGKEFYFKSDRENLVQVKDQSGKRRYFRKTSKLIYEISPGVFVHRSSLIKTEDGIFLDKNDENTVFVDGKPTKKEFTVKVNGKRFLKTSPELGICALTNGYFLKSEMIQLAPKYYTKPLFVGKTSISNCVLTDEGYIHAPDARKLLDKLGNEYVVHRSVLSGKNTIQVFHQFRDPTNPQLDRIDYINMLKEHEDATVLHDGLAIRVHKNHFDKLDKIYNEILLVREAAATEALRKALTYADAGPDENQAKVVKKILQPWPGKYNVYTPTDMSHVISKTCRLTGGLKYTFGLEIETSQGVVPNSVADRLKLKIVGDRSIGAGEYVTGVLHGDDGIKLLEQQCNAIAKYCFVDDRCGVHAHVGGIKGGPRTVADMVLDRHFAQYAISLGAQIEPELFATCPPSRKPTMKHCHSIMRWKDINDENWREYLGAFVFGEREDWEHPFNFADYKYGVGGRTKSNRLGDYCGGRYKWLNLVHVLSRSNINTCELRIFPGSTNFQKIYNYLMLSMAFVWFVENKTGRIVKGDVTLNEVLAAPFVKYPEIATNLIAFYDARKQHFNRKDLYPTTIPKAIF